MKSTVFIGITVLLLCIGTASVFGQSKIYKEKDKRENITFVKVAKDTVLQLKDAPKLLKDLQPGMKSTDEWKSSMERKDIQEDNGYKHQFYRQYHKGIRVEGGEFGVHAVNDSIETILGAFEPVGDVNVKTELSEEKALASALTHIGAEVYKWQVPEAEKWLMDNFNESYVPKGEPVIVKDMLKTNSTYRLAYKFSIDAHKPMSSNDVWVDAITGEIINIESRIYFSNATGTAATRYSGTRTITTDSYSGSYRLRETRNGVNISTFNMNHTGNYTSTDFTDNNNNWTYAEHHPNNNDAALDAHWGAEMVLDYFKQVHNRNSWDNNNGALLSYVNGDLHLISKEYDDSDNAFWHKTERRMTYGQGTSWSPVTALDICAHEIGHAICQSTAGLGNSGESGAINESLSDIWGACVENWATTGKQTWICGEDVTFGGLRNMSNPMTYNSTNYNLNAGVHVNCGVGNFWFFLLSQGGTNTNDLGNAYNVIGIGINKAARIVYKAETSYLTSSANYAQFRNATISAATNLYGVNSQEVVSVTNAWYAVGVGNMHPSIITGPSSVCPGTTGTFIANYALANVSVNWTCSSNLSISSSGNSATITNSTTLNNSSVLFAPATLPSFPVVNYDPEGWVKAELVGTGITLEKNFTVNKNTIWDFDLPATAQANTILIVNATTAVPAAVDWSVTPTAGVSWSSLLNDRMQITFAQNGLYTIQASTTNECGTFIKEKQISISGSTCPTCPPISLYVIVSPNPASSKVSIEIMNNTDYQSITSKPAMNSSYTISIVDIFGTSVYTGQKKGKKFNLSTASFRNGIYNVIVSDGTSTLQGKMIVKH